MVYADLECLLEKIHSCQNNPEKSFAEKKLGIRLLVIHCLQIFRLMRQKVSLYGKDCMEKFCKDLRGHAVKIISYEKKEIILLTNEENEYY